MTFTDTGAWFAVSVKSDENHVSALTWFRKNQQPLLTTDYIVDETLTLLRSRQQNSFAQALRRRFFSGAVATIYYLTEDDVRRAWQIFMQYEDKEWSFTDCTSKIVMEKLGILQAFALYVKNQ